MPAEWFSRGHAARIRAAARDAGFDVSVVHGFKIEIRDPKVTHPSGAVPPFFRATFNARTGQIQPSTIYTRVWTPNFHAYARHSGGTPADVARDVIGWLTSGAPEKWPHLPTALQLQLQAEPRAPLTRPTLAPVEDTPAADNVIPFRRRT